MTAKRPIKKPAVFLDRDGTVTEEVGYVNHESRLRLLPRSAEAIRLLNECGLRAVIVTNQSGVARGYFDEALPRAVAQAARYQHPLSVLLVDTDHFKEINDTHSHLVGDRVLRLVAETLSEHARAADTVCRYGGDEFVVILSSADVLSAAAFAERFRRRLRDRAGVALPGGTVRITATVGIATFLEDDGVRTPEDLLRLADLRLYMGKRAGRDRVVFRDVPVEVV